MNNAPAFLSTFSLSAIVNTTTMEPNIAYKPVIMAGPPDTACGKKTCPIPTETEASTIQLPMASPMTSSYCFFRRAIKSTVNSGRDVPIATKKSPHSWAQNLGDLKAI